VPRLRRGRARRARGDVPRGAAPQSRQRKRARPADGSGRGGRITRRVLGALMTTNPFEVLRLDPTATEEDVVRQADRLRQRGADEEALGAIRQAAMALTGRPEERALHALLAHPRPGHSSAALDRFAAAFRRAPVATAAPAPCPELDADEFRRLLLVAAAE